MAELQQKCAFIFVSHSMPQVMRVAKEIMVLEHGTVAYQGRDLGQGLQNYFGLLQGGETTWTGSGEVRVTDVVAVSGENHCGIGESIVMRHGSELTIRFTLSSKLENGANVVVQVLFWNQEMIPVLDTYVQGRHGFELNIKEKNCEVSMNIGHIPLNVGRYKVSLIITHPDLERVYCQMDNALGITVTTGNHSSGAGCLVEPLWSTDQIAPSKAT